MRLSISLQMWKTKCKAGNRVRGDLPCRPCHMYHATRYFTSNISYKFVHLVLFAGVIERNPELFKPKLPKEKTSSMQKMVFGTVNKIFIAYEKPFLHPDITEVGSDYWKYLNCCTPPHPHCTPQQFPPKVITLWNPVDEKVVPMAERWYRKIYSFCKGFKVRFLCERKLIFPFFYSF